MAAQGVASLSQQPWWTEADAAELDLLTHEMVKVALIHKRACCGGGPWCAAMRDAYAAVEEWRQGRILRSRAMHLRLEQSVTEWAAGIAA